MTITHTHIVDSVIDPGFRSNMPVTIYDPSGAPPAGITIQGVPTIRFPMPPAPVSAPQWLVLSSPWLVWLLLFAGLLLLIYVIWFRDRSKGVRRCPKCWYDMSATGGMMCPECGRTQAHEKRFFKRRRSWRLGVVAVVLLVASYGASVAVDVYEGGLMWATPRWALVVLAPSVETTDPPPFVYWQTPSGNVWERAPTGWTLDQELWEHLYTERVPRGKLSWIEYRLLRDDLRRRYPNFNGGSKLRLFASSQYEWILRDETLMREVLRQKLTQKTIQRRAGAVQFWLHKPSIVSDGLRAQWLDRTQSPPEWIEIDWRGLPPTVSIAQSGEHKDKLTMRYCDPLRDGPKRWIEVDVLLDDSLYERFGR